MKLSPLLLFFAPAVTVLGQAQGTVCERSMARAKAEFEYEHGESPIFHETETPTEVIPMDRVTIAESLVSRSLQQAVARRKQQLEDERYDPNRGGLIYRHEGRVFTVEAGVWSEGRIMELLRIRW